MFKLAASVLLLTSAFAGAQTVTVGTTSSTTSGSTTTITVPVSVAVPPTTTTAAAAAMATLRVDTGTGNGQPVNQSFSNSFKTVALSNVVADSASGWNATANTYTIPTTGTYLIVSNIRFMDGIPANVSYGQGVNTSNVDNPYFNWTTTLGLRNGLINMRVMSLSAGQTVDLFIYADSSNPLALGSASLSIQQLQ